MWDRFKALQKGAHKKVEEHNRVDWLQQQLLYPRRKINRRRAKRLRGLRELCGEQEGSGSEGESEASDA